MSEESELFEDPIFSYSTSIRVAGSVYTIAFGVAMGILSIYWALGTPAVILMFALAVFGCFSARAYFFTPARSAKFYENEFVIKGWKFKKRFKYLDIESLEAFKLPCISPSFHSISSGSRNFSHCGGM